jgi:tetrahydromethanopterin S-methyltransferase subunit F
MKPFTLILLIIVSKSLFAQTSPTPLTAIYRADSVCTPILLYKAENVRLNVLFRELQLCDSLTILDKKEIATMQEMNTVYKFELKKKNEAIRNLAEDNGLKAIQIGRNRKIAFGLGIFAIIEGLVIGLTL